MQKYKTGFTIFVGLCTLLWACTTAPKQEPAAVLPELTFWHIADTTCPLAYTILTLEQWCGLPVNTAEFDLVDRFLMDLSTQITLKQHYTRTDALQILKTIQDAVAQLRSRQLTYHSALYLCLRYRLFDCDINSFLFVTAAQHFNLPIQALIMPTHMSVVWNNKKDVIYWETTQNRVVTLQYYQQKYGLSDADTLHQTMLLSSPNNRQLMAVALFNIGNTHAEMGYAANALLYYKQALQLAPQWFRPEHASAFAYLQLQHPDSALLSAQNGLRLFARQPDLQEALGNAFLMLGCNTESALAFRKSAQLYAQNRYPDAAIIAGLVARADSVEFGY